MADLRLWSREVITDFIELYKTHACLWNVKCEGYKNKYTKSLAYKDLVHFCKNRGFPEANRDFVSRKLQSLRSSFRKELRKLQKSQRSGKSYETNLWYFNNLMFTVDNSIGDDHHSDEDDQSGDGEQYDDGEDVEDGKFLDEDKINIDVVDMPDSPSPQSPHPKRRKRPDCPLPEFFDVGQESTRLRELSEFELIGLNIAKKLARMDETQAIYAESVINRVILKGLLKKLKEETDLCDNLCAKRTVGVNMPSQSSSACLSHIGL